MLGKTTLLLIACILSSAFFTFDVYAVDTEFQRCNSIYIKGDYAQAVDCYKELEKSSGFNAALLYNLANAYAQSGQVGLAILHYERALRLSPNDADIRGNLDFLRKESGLFPPQKNFVDTFTSLLTIEAWSIISIICMALFLVLSIVAIKTNARKGLRNSGMVLTSACLLIAAFSTWKGYQHYNPSVVISPDNRLLISPFEGATPVGAISEGRLVTPQKTHGIFIYVIDETGKKGWLPASAISPVIP